jgi:predicted phosphodiesterase
MTKSDQVLGPKKIDPSIKILNKIQQRYNEKELKALAQGNKLISQSIKIPKIDFEGQHIKIAYMTDTHIGSVFFKEPLFDKAIKEFKKEHCDILIHTGDVTEGLSHRPGHIYDLEKIGYTSQKDYAIQLLKEWPKESYYISGNHDCWYMQNSNLGANIVQDIVKNIPKASWLGFDEGDLLLKGKTKLRMWHGLDANTYAVGYRVQKIIESFTGGEKPQILCCGHTHKALYMFERNVHAVSGGALSLQSRWMRGKRISNHTGFWTLDIWINKKGEVTKFSPIFYPFYK